MAQGIITKVFVDTSQFVKGMSTATKAASTFSKEVTVSAQTAARAQVNASVKTTEALQLQVAEYHKIAAAAEKGSKEQVVAAQLAAQAERRLAVSMGEVSVAAGRTGKGARGLGSDLEHAARGAISGSGALHGFTRSLAFASGGFLAFEGATKFLTDSITAAREAGAAQRSLTAQMKTSGESFAANREEIEKTALSYGKFGRDNDEVIAALTVLDRGTGNVNKAMGLLGVTADLAGAKHMKNLADAATVVSKVFGGQETALRRAVPGLEKNAHGWDLIREAQAKLAGQAAANTTASDKFASTLHNTEEIIGTALLPTLNKYLTSLSNWMQRMDESGQLQRDVTSAVNVMTGAINLATGAFHKLNDITGSTKNTLKLLFGVLVAYKSLKTAETLSNIAAQMANLRNQAPGPTGTPRGRRGGGRLGSGALGFLAGAGATILGPEGIAAAAGGYALSTLFRKLPGVEKDSRNLGANLYDIAHALGLIATNARKVKPFGVQGPVGKPGEDPFGFLQGPIGTVPPEIKRTAEQRNQWFDAMISRRLFRGGLEPLQQQLTVLGQVADLIKKRIAKTKDVTRLANLNDQLLQVLANRKDVRAQLAQQATDALALNIQRAGLTTTMSDDIAALNAVIANLDKRIALEKDIGKRLDLESQLIGYQQQRIQARQQAAEQAKAALEARQFRGLGLGPGGDALPPSIAALKKELTKVREAVKGTILDTRANRGMFARIASELAGHFGKLTDTVKQKVKEMLDNIDEQLKGHVRDRTRFSHINAANFVASLGLNLTPEQARRLQVRISQVGAGGTVPGGRTPAFAGVTVNGDVHVHGVQDTKGIERELHRRAKARANTRRGAT